MLRPACDGEEIPVRANSEDWLAIWYPPLTTPAGKAHGACGFCVTADREVVLISNDGARWTWPGGRPEADENWEQTFRREMLEETCCVVGTARLLGFCQSRSLSGAEKDLILVRSIWRGDVEMLPWQPRFEIAHRKIIPAAQLLSHLWMEEGLEPIYHRALIEAGLV